MGATKRARSGGRSARSKRTSRLGSQEAWSAAWGQFRGGLSNPFINRLRPYEILDEAEIEAIHDSSMRLLEEVGITFRGDAETLTLWRQAGARVEGENVKISRELAMELLALAPEEFTQHARDPHKSVRFGSKQMVFAPIFASPYVRDLENNRRQACLKDFVDLVKLTQASTRLNHIGAQICEPMDIAATRRHLEVTYGHLKYSDKPFLGDARGEGRARDCLRLCEIAYGKEFANNNVVLLALVSAASPLLWDVTMLEALKFYARNNQALIITPFTMQGANTPVTMAGALTQLNAEAVAGMALAQLVRPGTPVIYGCTLATASMKNGAPVYGTSEVARLTFAIGQLARRYKVPLRAGGNRNGAMQCDAMAGYQNMMTMLPAVLARTNYFLHSAGWLESSMSVSFAQFIIDLDQIAILQDFAAGIEVCEDTLAFQAISETSPGGDFFSNTHTLRHYKSIFLEPMMAPLGSYEAWTEAGGKDVIENALEWAKAVLDSYQPPMLDESVDDGLRAYVDERSRELPDIET
ncbi:MAG: trimethylamine methyltransferase family protein [Pseudomonadota bacterium]